MRHRWGWEPTCVFVGHTSGAHGESKLCGADHTRSCGSDGHRGCTAESLANRDRCDVECGRNRWLGRHLKCGCLDRVSSRALVTLLLCIVLIRLLKKHREHIRSYPKETTMQRLEGRPSCFKPFCSCFCDRVFCVPVAILAFSFVSCCLWFWTAAVSSNFLHSMGADDCSKGEGWQTQRKKGWMAGQMRMEELLAEAVTIDGRKEWYCGLCS